MKNIGLLVVLMLHLIACRATCRDWNLSLEKQLTSILTYPECAKRSIRGIVVVQFQVSEDSRICRVQVHSNDEQINVHFIRELTGRKLTLLNPNLSEVHTVRIHCQHPA